MTPARAFLPLHRPSEARVLAAQEEARRARHAEVGTEHLHLGFMHEPECLAVKAIESFGISRDALVEAVEPCLGAPQAEVQGHIPFSRHTNKVRNLALREALRLGQNYIGTEHMLLAMLRDEKSGGARILTDLRVSRKGAEQWIVDALGKLRSR